jgi:hypothetical protein
MHISTVNERGIEMKKAFLFLAAMLLIIALSYYYFFSKETTQTPASQDEQSEFGYVEAEDLVIKGIELGTSTENLDAPDKIEEHKQGECFYYPDYTLICCDGGEAGYIIYAINITGHNIKTKRGIGIGSSEMEVFKCYGNIGKNKDWITYILASDISEKISFKIIKGEVAEISVYSGNNPFEK